MEITIIILACFDALLLLVIYNLDRIIKKKDNQIEAIKAEIEKLKTTTESAVTALVLDELLTFINKQE